MYKDAAFFFSKLAKDQFDWDNYYKTGDELYKQQHTGADVFDPKFPNIPKFGQDGEYNPDYLTAAGIKVEKSGNMTAREGHFMAEHSKLRSTVPAADRAGSMDIDLGYGDKPRYDDAGNIKSPYMFEQDFRANAPTDVFDKMDYSKNFNKTMTGYSTDKPESPVTQSLETNNNAAVDLNNTINQEQNNTTPVNKSLETNNNAEADLNNTINNEQNNNKTTPINTDDGFSNTEYAPTNNTTVNPKVEEPSENPVPPTNTSKDLNEQAETNLDTTIKNEQDNKPTETSNTLNETAKTELDTTVQNNTVTNTEPTTTTPPASNRPNSFEDLKKDFENVKSQEGQVPGGISKGPSSYQESLGDKREYARKPKMFKGSSWLPSFIDELKKITL